MNWASTLQACLETSASNYETQAQRVQQKEGHQHKLCHKCIIKTNLPSAADGGGNINADRLTDTRAAAENWDSSIDWTWSNKGIAIAYLKNSSGLFEGRLLWWHCRPVMWSID